MKQYFKRQIEKLKDYKEFMYIEKMGDEWFIPHYVKEKEIPFMSCEFKFIRYIIGTNCELPLLKRRD